jgi:excisionase family DNA binding protein
VNATNARRSMADNGLLTITEASAMLRLRPSTLRAWILRRKLAYCKVGRLVRIKRADVEALITASIVPAREESGSGYSRSNGRLNGSEL